MICFLGLPVNKNARRCEKSTTGIEKPGQVRASHFPGVLLQVFSVRRTPMRIRVPGGLVSCMQIGFLVVSMIGV